MRSFRASAPGRCGILGNPSDIYGGFVVSCTVPMRAHCVLEFGTGEAYPEDRRLWDAVVARFPVGPCRVGWTTEVPRSSGLSGSTALLEATLACALQARGEFPSLASPEDRTWFAELARDIELNEAQVVCGYQDATVIAHGGLKAMDFAGKHPVLSGPPPRVQDVEIQMLAEDGGLPFLLATTGVERLSGSVHGPMRDRWMRGEPEVVDAMRRIAEIGRLGVAALEKGDWAQMAELFHENHSLVAGLGGSGEPVDRLIALCEASGAKAAKLAGAGLGGTVIALTLRPTELAKKLQEAGVNRLCRPERRDGVRLELAD